MTHDQLLVLLTFGPAIVLIGIVLFIVRHLR